MAKIQIRITPSFASMLGTGDYDWHIIDQNINGGTTLGGILTGLSRDNPGFGRVLFDPRTGKISQEIMITLNDRLLQGQDTANATLKDGDIVVITPAYEGG